MHYDIETFTQSKKNCILSDLKLPASSRRKQEKQDYSFSTAECLASPRRRGTCRPDRDQPAPAPPGSPRLLCSAREGGDTRFKKVDGVCVRLTGLLWCLNEGLNCTLEGVANIVEAYVVA